MLPPLYLAELEGYIHFYVDPNALFSLTDSQEELLEIIEGAKRRWVLKVLHHGLNIGLSYDDLKNKDALLECFQRPTQPPYNFVIPDLVQEYPQRQRDNIMILPLSIKDKTTTAGTASILRNYAREFNLTCLVPPLLITFQRIKQESLVWQQLGRGLIFTRG